MKLPEVEALLMKQIEELSAIKADLAWLKKAFWVLATANVTFNVTLASSIILYLIKIK